jgi:O-antigen ligase
MRAAVHPLRVAAPWLAVAGVALLSGAFATGQANAWVGDKPALLLLAALVGGSFLIVFGFLGSSAVVIWPVAATGGYLLGVPRTNPVLTFDRVWIFGLLAYIALDRRHTQRTPATRLLFLALLWLLCSYGLRAFATSASITGPARGWLDAIVLPTILFVACERYSLLTAARGRRLAGALMIAGGILGAIGIAEHIFGFELATVTGGSVRFDEVIDQTRVSGPYAAPEPYALSLIICFAATLYWILSRGRGSNYGWGLLFAGLQLAGIGFALFRAGWIAAIVVAVAAFGFRPGKVGRTFAVAGLTAALAVAATGQLQQNKTVATRVNNTENISSRLATYKQGIELFRSAPLFGIGVDRYHTVSETRPVVFVSGVPSVPYPHSSYVGLLAEQGVMGFLPLLLLSFAVWRLVRALRSASFQSREATLLMGTVAGAALGYLIMSLTLTMLPYAPSNLFLAALLGVASGRLDALTEHSTEPSS